MPVPSPRNSIRIARGNYSDLNSNISEIGDGELCFALDQDKFYSKGGGVLIEVGKGTAIATLGQIADVDVAAASSGQVLSWNGTNWVAIDAASGGGAVDSVAGKTGAVTLVKADITDFSDSDYATAAQGTTADSALQPGSNISLLVNNSGYITGYTVTSNDVTAHEGDLTIAQSQVTSLISDLDLKADLVGGVIPNSQLPSLAISEYLGTAANQSAMLALSGQRGDWAIRTDTGSTWVITTDGGSSLSDWTELATPADAVASVNGYQGTVVLSASDVGAATSAQGSTADSAVQPTDSINALNDVDTATVAPTEGQTLVWDNTAGKWEPGTISISNLPTLP